MLGGVVAGEGTPHQRILGQTGIDCEAIWGTWEESPSANFGYTYLILQIR